MKICHIVPSLEQRHGGPSRSVRALCAALADLGDTVELLTTDPAESSPSGSSRVEGSLTIRTFPRAFPQRLCPSGPLRAALDRVEADVIHHHGLWLRTLHYSSQASAKQKRPLVISPRGMMSRWAWGHHRWRKVLSRALVHPGAFTRAAAWHATSKEESRDIEQLGFTQPTLVVPNGVELPGSNDQSLARSYWQRICPQTCERPTAVFYGRLHQKKRVIELIDAWLEHARHDWLLLIVGIPETYRPAQLEAHAVQMGGGGRIRAFNGDGVPPPYGIASLFLLPSHNENFGMTVAEALAWGVPALVTDTTPWGDLNEQGCGWCVPWEKFGHVLVDALTESPTELAARGAIGSRWVATAFSWRRSAAEMQRGYRTLLGQP